MKRVDLQNLSLGKLRAAEVLADNKSWSNAYYLAGYSIEFSLKACVAKSMLADAIPDKNLINKIYTHDIKMLLGLASLKAEFNNKKSGDRTFEANWAICCEWSPDARYKDKSASDTTYLLGAISDKTHGVLPWIKNYW